VAPEAQLLSASAAASLSPATPQQQASRSDATVASASQAQTQAAASATGQLPGGSSVPNGLIAGGLVPEGALLPVTESPGSLDIPASWKGVKSLYQTKTASGKTIIDIIQSPDSQFAYLNWSGFNLGPKTVLNFLQNTSLLSPVGPVASGQTVLALSSVKGLFSGQGLIGDGIKGGTKITKVDATSGTITLSSPITDALFSGSVLGAILENAGTFTAFNSVNGGGLSHLFGSLNASGQVYLLNQAGITFHAGSAVNARGLLASTLPINANLTGSYTYNPASGGYTATVGRGIANNPDSQFLFSALPVEGNGNLKTLGYTPVVNGPIGDVTVERGASLRSPVDANNSGGKIALIGANVVNGGSLSTPFGQTMLAAGLQVALTPHNSSDPSLRGLDVTIGRIEDPDGAVTAVSGTAGSVTQDGVITIPSGSAALAGASITTGAGSVIDGLTTTGLNGRIDVSALYNAVANPQFPNTGRPLVYENGVNSGSITLGEGSLLRILPDWNDTTTKVVGASLALNSLMTVTGSSIDMGSGALLLAPGAVATQGALSMNGESLGQGVLLRAGSFFDAGGANSLFVADGGSVTVGSGAGIILSGSSEIAAPSSEYMISLQLRGAELANNPLLQNNKEIRGKDLLIDTRYTGTLNGQSWVGTPLGDIAGYLNLVTRNVGELTTAGGSLVIQAGSSVSVASGALLDVSGGSVRYSGGTFAPSQLVTATGKIVPMYFAQPNDIYTGIVKNPVSLTESPYSQGASGGSIAISAPELTLDGSLRGVTTAGPRQVRSLTSVSFKPTPAISEVTALPVPSSLAINLSGQQIQENLINTVSATTPVAVRFGKPSSAREGELVLDPGLLSGQGFRNFSLLNHDGSITVPSGVRLDSGANGSVRLEGATVSVQGAITAPSGRISLTADATPYVLQNAVMTLVQGASFLGVVVSNADGQPYYQYGPVHEDGSIDAVGADGATVVSFAADEFTPSDSGSIRIGPEARLSTAGTLVDGRALAAPAPILTEGGSITLNGLHVSVAGGSVVDVSAGAFLGYSGKWTYGSAGNLSLLAGKDGTTSTIHNGTLGLGGTLLGYAAPGQRGGSLTLGAQAFQIGEISSRAGLSEGDTLVTLSSVRGFAVGQSISGKGIEAGTVISEIDVENGTVTLSQPATASISSTKVSASYGPESLRIDPQSFYGNGFSSLSLSAIGLETSYGAGLSDGPSLPGILVAPGAVIAPSVAALTPVLQPDGGIGRASVPSQLGYAPSLSLNVSGLSDSALATPLQIIGYAEIGQGASIRLNPALTSLPTLNPQKWTAPTAVAGSFSLSAPTLVVAGSVSAPGGSIRLSGKTTYPSDEPLSDPLITTDLTPTARLSTRGTALTVNDPTGVYGTIGTVLSGGTVDVAGDFLAEPGSVIDVSGASATLGVPGAVAGSAEGVTRIRVDSAGGAISVTGGDMFVMNSTLLGRSGGATASGGSLRFAISAPVSPIDPALYVTQAAPDLDGLGLSGEGTGPALSHLAESGPIGGNLGVDTFSQGGFSSVTLLGNTAFTGEISLAMKGSLAIAASPAITRDPVSGFVNRPQQGGVITADSPVTISADALSLGMAFAGPLAEGDPFALSAFDGSAVLPPTPGDGALHLTARQIDVGNLSLQSISTTELTTGPGGMIRGDGSFVLSGALSMTAGVIAPVSATTFGITAFPIDDSGSSDTLGSITTAQSGTAPLPWSAGGTLALYASTITHGGTLSAPHGTILLGRSTGSAEVIDPVAGPDVPVPVTQSLTLAAGSTVSVSGIDPVTGKVVVLPYGTSSDGTSWTDPARTDITGRGLPSKTATIDADSIITEAGSKVDLRGGGELVASQWISGLGGTIHYSDNASGNYALVPGYSAPVAPNGPSEGGLAVGSRIRISGGGGLPAGTYTLLPASYAELPGAYLIAPFKGQGLVPPSGLVNPDGTVQVTGSVYNGFSSAPSPLQQSFTLYSPSVLKSFQQVNLLKSSSFFSGLTGTPRTADGGRLRISGSQSMELHGGVRGSGASGGAGAVIDIASSAPFLITGSAGPSSEPAAGTIVLDSSVLSTFESSSLLIGGTRILSGSTTRIAPLSSSVTVDSGANLGGQQEFLFAAAPQSYTTTGSDETPSSFASQYSFSAADLIAANIHSFASAFGVTEAELTANPSTYLDTSLPEGTTFHAPGASVVVAPDAVISVSGTTPSRSYSVSGDGAIALVSAGTSVSLTRSGFSVSLPSLRADVPLSSLTVGSGASVSGASVILDSSGVSVIDPTLNLKASSVSVSAGAVSAGAEESGALSLSGALLESLNASDKLSLTSYSTLALHDGAALGSARLASLSLHAAAITGDGGNASVSVSPDSGSLRIDNATGSILPSEYAPVAPAGTLSLTAGQISLGEGSLRIDGFRSIGAVASQGVASSGTGDLALGDTGAGTDLRITTPVVTAEGGSRSSVRASGSLDLISQGADPGVLKPGLGGVLSLSGNGVTIAAPVKLPSGNLTISSSGDLVVSSPIDLSGRLVPLNGHPAATGGGSLQLSSGGNLTLGPSALIDLSAPSSGGDAGSLSLSVPSGDLLLGGAIRAAASAGASGKFSADLRSLDPSGSSATFAALETYLGNASGGFSRSQSFRVRNGDVTVSSVKASSFRLGTDSGAITVNGTIDASGVTGGSIALFAGGDLTLASGSRLKASGNHVDAAGKGGSVDLESVNGTIDLRSGSVIDLSLSSAPSSWLGQSYGSLMLSAPQTFGQDGLPNGVRIAPIGATVLGTPGFTAVASTTFDAADAGPASIDAIPVWGMAGDASYPTGLAYQPGEQVIGSDGNAYRLTTDREAYSQYVATQVAGGSGTDPADSFVAGDGFWTPTSQSWENLSGAGEGIVDAGTKVLDQPGRDRDGNPTGPYYLYTARNAVDLSSEPAAPSDDQANWTMLPDSGNLRFLAVANASSALFNAGYGSTLSSFAGAPFLAQVSSAHLQPGERIQNSLGGLVLNSAWDLSTTRSGPVLAINGSDATVGTEPGLLTLRAAGDMTFRGSLSDGFGDSLSTASQLNGLYSRTLLPLLRDGANAVSQRSWAYRISAGADIGSSDSTVAASGGAGSVILGIPGQPWTATQSGQNASTASVLNQLNNQYQVIRTGTGDITVSASGDIRLLSPLSSIYTAGTRTADPTTITDAAGNRLGSFDLPSPNLTGQYQAGLVTDQQPGGAYEPQYSSSGGNVTLKALGNILRENAVLDGDANYTYGADGTLITSADSSLEMPSNWLYRRGSVDPKTGRFQQMSYDDQFAGNDVASTTWWVDFSNFFQDVGALGGGNIVLSAGGNIANVSASVPTNLRMAARDAAGNLTLASSAPSVELGGGNISVTAGGNIDGGVYYVERGNGEITAAGSIITNPTRDPALPSLNGYDASASAAWLPTTLYLGKGNFSVSAGDSVRLGPVANPFLTTPGINNSFWYKTYFSTYAPGDTVTVKALSGNVTIATAGTTSAPQLPGQYAEPLLQLWFQQGLPAVNENAPTAAYFQPWLSTSELNNTTSLGSLMSLMPPTLSATAFGGDITLQGNVTLAPSASGNLSLIASKGISGLANAGNFVTGGADTPVVYPVWLSSVVNVSDASPALVPSASSPLSLRSSLSADDQSNGTANGYPVGATYITDGVAALFAESGSYAGVNSLLAHKLTLHDPTLLHAGDHVPVLLDAASGNIGGLTLYSPKLSEIRSGGNISDVGLYLQNVSASDITTVSAAGDIRLYDPTSQLRVNASVYNAIGNADLVQSAFPSGDIQIGGPGTLEVLAGRSVDLGNAPSLSGDTTIWNGITSIGNNRNPGLSFQGADVVVSAGIRLPGGLTGGGLDPSAVFAAASSLPGGGKLYGELISSLEASGQSTLVEWLKGAGSLGNAGNDVTVDPDEKALAALRLYYLALRDSGRAHNDPAASDHTYAGARAVIAAFLDPNSLESAGISAWQRSIATANGGDISLLVPKGGVSLSAISTGASGTPPGIITKHGGSIDIYTAGDVSLGIGRIFTLRGGNILIWSDKGSIAAGSSAKTVASAPPASILIDPASADVQNDLAGLSTGGGIGVLATVSGVPPGDVDLYAPAGVIDAGDAGIRASGNFFAGATKFLNADNLQITGHSVGAPAAPAPAAAAPAAAAPAAPAAAPAAAPSSAAAAANNKAADTASKTAAQKSQDDDTPSIYSIDVLGYGGSDKEDEDENAKKSASL
jgi:filamentous hemagglutinin family protein